MEPSRDQPHSPPTRLATFSNFRPSALSVRADRRVHGTVDHDDLPIVSDLPEGHCIDALDLICRLKRVVETGPARIVPIAYSKIRDAQFARRSRHHEPI